MAVNPDKESQEGCGGARLADPRLPSARSVAHPDRLGRPRPQGERHGRPRGGRHRGGARLGHPAVARRRPPRRFPLVRLAPLAIAFTIVLGACDGSRTQAPPPLDPPVQPERGRGACSQTDVDGATVVRFESDGSCLPGDVMVLYRCAPAAVPVLRISSVAGPALFLGGPFAVPVKTLPAHVRFAGSGHGTEVLIADPLPAEPFTAETSALGEPLCRGRTRRPSPSRSSTFVTTGSRNGGSASRAAGRATIHPIVWMIGDSILDGGRDAIEARLADWNLTLDAEVGRSSSSGVALAQEAADPRARTPSWWSSARTTPRRRRSAAP